MDVPAGASSHDGDSFHSMLDPDDPETPRQLRDPHNTSVDDSIVIPKDEIKLQLNTSIFSVPGEVASPMQDQPFMLEGVDHENLVVIGPSVSHSQSLLHRAHQDGASFDEDDNNSTPDTDEVGGLLRRKVEKQDSQSYQSRTLSYSSVSLQQQRRQQQQQHEQNYHYLYDDLEEPLLGSSAHRRRQYVAHLNGLNYLNLVTMVVYGLIVIICGLWGPHHMPTNWEIRIRPTYQTLINPSYWIGGDFIWTVPVLMAECVFTCSQLLPSVRSRAQVQSEGVAYFFFYTGLAEVGAIFADAFAGKGIFIAIFFLLVSFACLYQIVTRHYGMQQNYNTTPRAKRWSEYMCLTFPFVLHMGWCFPRLVIHISMISRHYFPTWSGMQLATDICALSVLLVAAVLCMDLPRSYNHSSLTATSKKMDIVVPFIVMVNYMGIAARLCHPDQAVIDAYGNISIVAIRDASWFLSFMIATLVIPRVMIWSAREFWTIQVVELNADDEDTDLFAS